MACTFVVIETYKGNFFKWTPSEAKLMSKVVRLTSASGRGSCSGEQVKAPSGENYILTAAHCLSLASPDKTIRVMTEDGRDLPRRVIAEDEASDLALIEGLPNMEGIQVAKINYRNQPVRTFTHGAGLATYKTEGVLIEERDIMVFIGFLEPEKCSGSKYKIIDTFLGGACVMDVREMATTALTVPGSSGGMVVNDSGELVGVVSAGGGGMGWLVTLDHIRSFLGNY